MVYTRFSDVMFLSSAVHRQLNNYYHKMFTAESNRLAVLGIEKLELRRVNVGELFMLNNVNYDVRGHSYKVIVTFVDNYSWSLPCRCACR